MVARQALSLHRRDDEDEFADLADEEIPLPYVDPYSQRARPAPRCACPAPIADDGLCHVCGHTLAVGPQGVAEAA